MKNCRRITEIVSDSHERPLKISEKLKVNSHLMLCPGCRAFKNNSLTLNHIMRSLGDCDKQPSVSTVDDSTK